MLIYIVAGFGILLATSIIGAGVFVSRRGDTATLERLDQLVGAGPQDSSESDQENKTGSESPSALTDRLNEAIESRGWGEGFATELARADLKFTVAEFWSLTVIAVIVGAAIAWLVYGGYFMPIGGAGAGFFAPRMWVKMRQKGRLKTFSNQLNDGITLMANGLRAGYSLLQAMDAVGREMPDPIGAEFRRVVREIGLGVDPEKAFNNLLRRVPSDDLDLMVTAINVQQEVGGNLAEIFDVIGEVIRERIRIKGMIQVLTSQGQLSGNVISALPIILGLVLFAMNQEYIGRMVFSCEERGLSPEATCSQPCGWIMIAIGLMGVATGYFAIQKIVDIEV